MFRIDSVICSVFTSGIMCVTIPPVKAAYSKKAAEWRDHIVNAEVLAFVLYFVLMLAIGLYFFFATKKNSSEKEYFLGAPSVDREDFCRALRERTEELRKQTEEFREKDVSSPENSP